MAGAERLGVGLGLCASGSRCSVFLFNVVWSLVIKREPAEANPWHAKSHRVAAAHAGARARLRSDARVRRRPVPLRGRAGSCRSAGVRAGRGRRIEPWKPPPLLPSLATSSPSRPSGSPARSGSGGRLLCGAISFFFASFVFAFFYLKALDVNHNWKIGNVVPDRGHRRRDRGAVPVRRGDLPAGREAPDGRPDGGGHDRGRAWALLAVALQFFEYTMLDFGAASGGYAAVFFGWTSTYAIVALLGPLLDRDAGGEPVAGATRGRHARDRSAHE